MIENHGGVGSEHPEELIEIFKEVGGSFVGALPDFGNFPDEETRLRGLALYGLVVLAEQFVAPWAQREDAQT